MVPSVAVGLSSASLVSLRRLALGKPRLQQMAPQGMSGQVLTQFFWGDIWADLTGVPSDGEIDQLRWRDF